MLQWEKRWKQGIFHSMRKAKIKLINSTVPIWEMWDPDRLDESVTKINKYTITETKPKKFKELKITTKLKVTTRWRSTSKATGYNKRIYVKESIKDFVPKEFVPKKNNNLFVDKFNDYIKVEQ